MFFLNLPLAVVVVAVDHPACAGDQGHRRLRGEFDIAGAVLAALALGGITYALIEAPEQAAAGSALLVAGVLGVAAAVAFVLVERRRTRHPDTVAPMLPLDVFALPRSSARST